MSLRILACVILTLAFQIEPAPAKEKQKIIYESTQSLIHPMIHLPEHVKRYQDANGIKRSAEYEFNKSTVYVMNNFRIIQKIHKGYLITPNQLNNSQMQFDIAFLKTSENYSEDTLLSGSAVYIGQFKYTGMDGFTKSIPMLKPYTQTQ